jgi:hypothetical protein
MDVKDIIREFLLENGYDAEIVGENELEILYPMNEGGTIFLRSTIETKTDNSNAPMIYYKPSNTTVNIAHPDSIDILMKAMRQYEISRTADVKLVEEWGIDQLEDMLAHQRALNRVPKDAITNIAAMMDVIEKEKKENQ